MEDEREEKSARRDDATIHVEEEQSQEISLRYRSCSYDYESE